MGTKSPVSTESTTEGLSEAVRGHLAEAQEADIRTRLGGQAASMLPTIKWGKPSKEGDAYNGQVTHAINSLDPDFETAKLGQSAEMCIDSLGVLVDAPWVCLLISGLHVATLKVQKKVGGAGKPVGGVR